ncbi:MAG TPA: hypothetical protein VNT30_10465 [Stellaceae bacterium]|nr:hypothetical protein [Stellaceae bacterium]
MSLYAVYDPATGRIVQMGLCPPEMVSLQARAGLDVITVPDGTVFNDVTHYVVAGAVTPRPSLTLDKTAIAANGTDTAILSGLPNPCTVFVDGTSQTVTDGVLELSATMAESWTLAVDRFPYLPFKATVVAS